MKSHPSHKMDAAKRARLFDIAIGEFVSHGFAQASLNRIIKAAGMSKSSFYHYFANKTELFQQIIEQSLEPFGEIFLSFDLENLTADTFWQSMFEGGKEAAGMVAENPQIILLGRMFWKSRENIKEQGLTSDFLNAARDTFFAFLKRGQQLGVVRSDLPDTLLVSAVMALGMSLDQWVLENFHTISQDDFDNLNHQSMDIFYRLLAPKTP